MKRRLSPEKEQEELSRSQFAAFLKQYGWVVDDILVDIGEDLLVRILDDGVSSGIAAFFQLKSISDINQYKLRGKQISYPVKVDHLEHWEQQGVPVVLVVWDVTTNKGYWIYIPDVIEALDNKNTHWRKQKQVSIRIPLANELDRPALQTIRQRLADHYLPVIGRNKPFEIRGEFEFPDTPEGKATMAALHKFRTAGDPVTIDGKYVKSLEFSDWHKRLYGEIDFTADGLLKLSPKKTDDSIPMRLDALPGGSGIPYVDLHVLKAGTEEATLSNEHQPIPTHIQLVMNEKSKSGRVTMRTDLSRGTAKDIHESLSFLQALAHSTRIKLTNLITGQSLQAEYGEVDRFMPFDEAFLQFIADLSFIEEKTGVEFHLEGYGISPSDRVEASNIAAILRTGYEPLENKEVNIVSERPGVEEFYTQLKQNPDVRIIAGMEAEEVIHDLLGQEVNLGKMQMEVSGKADISVEELKKAIETLGPTGTLNITIKDLEGFVKYFDWLSEDEQDTEG